MHTTKTVLTLAVLALTNPTLAQKSNDEYCSAFFTCFLSVILASDAPTPTGIASWVAAQTPVTTAPPISVLDFASHASELCYLATALPESLLPEFSTYAADLLEFGFEYSSEHIAYVTDCAPENEVASRSSYLEFIYSATATDGFCENSTLAPVPGGASSGTGAYSTVTATVGGNNSSTLIVTAAAAKPTGVYLGAAAVGGMIGAAALL